MKRQIQAKCGCRNVRWCEEIGHKRGAWIEGTAFIELTLRESKGSQRTRTDFSVQGEIKTRSKRQKTLHKVDIKPREPDDHKSQREDEF